MKRSKQLLFISIAGLYLFQSTKPIEMPKSLSQKVSEPIRLQKLKAQENRLRQELLKIHDSQLHQSKLKVITKTAQAKVNKQAKIDNKPDTEYLEPNSPEYWQRQIAITTITIQDLQKLLQREREGKDSSSKIHSDLKNEFFLANQEPEARNQTLES